MGRSETGVGNARNLEVLARLRPMDDDFMRALFRDDLPLAQYVLRTITGVDDLVLVEGTTQLDLKWPAGPHSVVLDVWGRDAAGAWYDLELQRGNEPDPRRARYYSSAMDAEALTRGTEFAALPESYVIFVMERDPFHKGVGVYRFKRRDDETGVELDDGAHVLYVNGRYRGADALGRLMADINESDPARMSPGPLRDRAAYYKSDPKGVASMCELMEEIRAEGVKQGIERERLAGVRSLMTELRVSAERAMELLGIPQADRPRLASLL